MNPFGLVLAAELQLWTEGWFDGCWHLVGSPANPGGGGGDMLQYSGKTKLL